MTGDAHARRRVEDATDVLSEAFAAYPVMRWVFGADGDFERRLRVFVGFAARARVLRGEPILLEPETARADAAALVSFPGRVASPPELDELRERVFAELGPAATARYGRFVEAAGAHTVEVPHVHLNMIGVRARARGTGLGRRLLERVHALSAAEPWSEGVSLTTEDPRNVPLYEHFGYALVGHARVSESLATWSFFRPDRA